MLLVGVTQKYPQNNLLCVGIIDCGDIVSTDLYMSVHTLTPGHILGTHWARLNTAKTWNKKVVITDAEF